MVISKEARVNSVVVVDVVVVGVVPVTSNYLHMFSRRQCGDGTVLYKLATTTFT